MHSFSPARRPGAFTLIELLIVVAIIAILAAIAVPNFLEAQVRAKASRAKSDMRSLTTGLESYYVDNNAYPDIPAAQVPPPGFKVGTGYSRLSLVKMTTPISYLTTALYPDPFRTTNDPNNTSAGAEFYFGYANLMADGIEATLQVVTGPVWSDSNYAAASEHRYVLQSLGPDNYNYAVNPNSEPTQGFPFAFGYLAGQPMGWNFLYDPTNGTTSVGDIVRTGKGQLGS
jgi:prepilin-type N-terminal cleavage/methylation domain-containing protein